MKQSLFSALAKLVGGFLGVAGLGLLAYSLYILFFLPEREELLQLLPQENFEFALFTTPQKSEQLPNFDHLPFSVQNVFAVVGYANAQTNITEYIYITPRESGYTGLTCEEIKGYFFCSQSRNSLVLYQLQETIEQKEYSRLSSLYPFHSNEQIFLEDSTVSFFGTTAFLSKNVDNFLFFLPAQDKSAYSDILTLSSNTLQYFAGNIQKDTDLYTLSFYKEGDIRIFPKSLSSASFPSTILNKNTKEYVLIKKPKYIVDFLQNTSNDSHLSLFADSYTVWKDWAESLFANKASWRDDIEPMLATDILLLQSYNNEKASLFAFPNTSLSSLFYNRFESILSSIASEKVPEKKGFPLQDGSMIYEIVPSNKNTTEEKGEDKNGEYALFSTSIPGESKDFVQGLVRKNEFILMSDTLSFARNFWRPKPSASVFTFPVDSDVFFSFGTKDNEDSFFTQAEITGKEDENKILFVGKIEWNQESILHNTPFSIEGNNAPIGISTPSPSPQ